MNSMLRPHQPWDQLSDKEKIAFLLQYCHNIDVALDAQNRNLVAALDQMYSRIEEKKWDDADSRPPQVPP